MAAHTSTFLREMDWRGQVQPNGCTDPAGLDAHLAQAGRRAYVGFDPTADSLTIGNLVGIMALARWQRCGHTPVAVMGGGTGLIGDPSGKSAERTLNTEEVVRSNVEKIRGIFERGELFEKGSASTDGGALRIVNNIDWLGKLGFLEALRDIGKHFSVNMMIQKDSVKERLHNRDQGISYTEFSYMILQAYDFFWLRQHEGVSVQMGGSDQFGNIVTGIDLIRKKAVPGSATKDITGHLPEVAPAARVDAFGLTWPLVTKADGGKFGKTESGAIWLSSHRTSPFAYSQFWLNAADADVVRFLKTFTFLSQEEVGALEHKVKTEPGAREAQRVLAREATAIIHGRTEAANAEGAARALFSGEISGLPLATLEEVLASAPSSTHGRSLLEAGVPLLDLLVDTKLAASKREAKEFLGSGSVSVNGRKAGAEEKVGTRDLLHGTIIALRRGKKQWHVTRWG
ncbi:MAG: tyrosine--tRNA ligase [Phycisphaerales bacterium]